MHTPRMYVLVRKDLDCSYRLIQGSHALAQYAIDHPIDFQRWGNGTIVFLSVRNLFEIKAWCKKIEELGSPLSLFQEPDLENQPTAIAYYGYGEPFKNLNLA